jgi:UDP-N-acetylglucosamine 2-epimerase (non-hydrolysing)
MKNIIVILGTRPEAIKLAPVILELRKNPEYKVFVCNTEQQKELSNQTLGFFGIVPDFNLDVMCPNQTLAGVQSRIMTALTDVFQNNHFDATIVQGDTMSVFCGALASFYNRVPVFHVEAGLRSYDLFEPFPEEAMRQMTSRITDLHFAPTQLAYDSLIKENINEVKKKMAAACERSHRNVSDVVLICVSKTKPVELLMEAYEAGARGVVATPTSCGAYLFAKMYDELFVQNDREAANLTHQQICLLDNAIDSGFCASAKYLVSLCGIDTFNWYTRGSHELGSARLKSLRVFHEWCKATGLKYYND